MNQKNTYFEPHGAPKAIENAKKRPPEKHLKYEPEKVCKNDQNKEIFEKLSNEIGIKPLSLS